MEYNHFQAEGKIIPKTDQREINISYETPFDLGFGH